MIYNKEYKVKFYQDSHTRQQPALEFIKSLDKKIQLKIFKYLDYLKDKDAYLDEPYSRHIEGKIRELRVDFSNNHYRLFYFCVIDRNIIILHAYLKKTNKTPINEILRAKANLINYINNIEKYEN